MDRLTDKTLVALCCFALLLLLAPQVATVAGFLLAVIIAAAGELRRIPRWLWLGCVLLYLCATLAIPAFIPFVPLVIYDCVRTESWILHLAWIPFAALACRGLDARAVIGLGLICAVSAVLARKTLRLDSEAAAHNAQSDELRGYSLALAQKNRALKEKQDYELQLATLGERARIARDIHDSVGHLLTRASLQVEALRIINAGSAEGAEDPRNPALDEELQGLGATINEALDSVRESVHDLHDDAFDLGIRLRALAAEEHAFEIALNYQVDHIPAPVGYSLVAIASEALTNVDRHSDASRVELSAFEYPAFFQLTVADNGTRNPFGARDASGTWGEGFNPGNLSVAGGIGLRTMEERVRNLGGVFKIEYGGGVRVFVSIPKTAEQETMQETAQEKIPVAERVEASVTRQTEAQTNESECESESVNESASTHGSKHESKNGSQV